jgi:hypothetical protein
MGFWEAAAQFRIKVKLHKRSKREEGKDREKREREKRERKRFSKTILKNLSFLPKLFWVG